MVLSFFYLICFWCIIRVLPVCILLYIFLVSTKETKQLPSGVLVSAFQRQVQILLSFSTDGILQIQRSSTKHISGFSFFLLPPPPPFIFFSLSNVCFVLFGFFKLFLFRSEYAKPRIIELQYAIVLKLFFYTLSSHQKISIFAL